ncbi:MAG: MCE family protein [Piscinibacter sp.]|uniref:MlaD family protein n=1 Tax=Piscinibacter sp. TaxID=1903157 RepID=UPI0025834B28|nr:MlaD family protein [Piscinibacter sp.]MCW5666562.1 MCE family protein [Piscinibacter sp.]
MSAPDPLEPAAPIANVELKAAALLLLFVLLVGSAALYLLYARGAFEPTQRLVLIAEDSEGVRVGMDLTFAGFPVGRVRDIELGADGQARILVDVPRKDARWLRETSVFTLTRSVVGGANLRAYTGLLEGPELADGAQRPVLIGDTAAEMPKLVSAMRELIDNLTRLTAGDGPLAASLANIQVLTEKLNGPRGAAGLLLGNEADTKKLSEAVARTNALLARLDGIAARADAQVLGPDGLVRESRATIQQLNAMLLEARGTLRKVDGLLEQAQGIAGDVKGATTDLGALRQEVDATVRKLEQMVDEVNRRWPFARDNELKLR